VRLVAGTRAAALYGVATVDEEFWCNFGLNPAYRERLTAAGVCFSGVDDDGDVRLLELPSHPFYIATLFLPQKRSTPDRPHPLLEAFSQAARQRRMSDGDDRSRMSNIEYRMS